MERFCPKIYRQVSRVKQWHRITCRDRLEEKFFECYTHTHTHIFVPGGPFGFICYCCIIYETNIKFWNQFGSRIQKNVPVPKKCCMWMPVFETIIVSIDQVFKLNLVKYDQAANLANYIHNFKLINFASGLDKSGHGSKHTHASLFDRFFIVPNELYFIIVTARKKISFSANRNENWK